MHFSIRRRGAIAACLAAALALAGTAQAQPADSGFIAAAGCKDIAFDVATSTLYISGGPQVRRYDLAGQRFLSAIRTGGQTAAMDISPDGRRLAVANTGRGATTNFVDVVSLNTGRKKRISFTRVFGEGGTFAVAYDGDGKLLVTSLYDGDGRTPLRRYDPATGLSDTLGSVNAPTMLSASPDRRYIAAAEGNSPSGLFGLYQTGDATYQSTGSLGWFLFEIGVSPEGQQIAIPTFGGTFIEDRLATIPPVGEYAGVTPMGVAYAPSGDVVYYAFAQTNYVAEYDRRTMTELRRFSVPGSFEWGGPFAFIEGRTKVSADGRYLFVTVDGGVFYQSLAAPAAAPTR